MREKIIGRTSIYIITFIVTAVISAGLLLVSAAVPDEAVKSNMLSSAEFLCEREVFYDIIPGVPASKVDAYADSITLNIAYHLDSDDPLRSVMLAAFHTERLQNENINLRESVRDDVPAETEYLR